LREAIVAARQYVQIQGRELLDCVVEDSLAALRLQSPVSDVEEAIRAAIGLQQLGVVVTMRFSLGDMSTDLVRVASGWDSDEFFFDLFTELSSSTEPDHWSSDQIAEAAPTHAATTVDLLFMKERWRAPIEAATGATAWMGPSLGGFQAWIGTVPWQASLRALMSRPVLLVLIDEWVEPPLEVGSRMVVGSWGAVASSSPVDRPWPVPVENWVLRGADLRPNAEVAGELAARLRGLAVAAAAQAIAWKQDEELFQPAQHRVTTWRIGPNPRADEAGAAALLGLFDWVTVEANITRLEIVQTVSADQILDPLSGPPIRRLLEAAELAYQLAIDARVGVALAAQQALESSFREIDERLTDLIGSIVTKVDGVVVRAVLAAFAILLAALASKEARGWPSIAGLIVVASYLLFASRWQFGLIESDIAARSAGFSNVLRGRDPLLRSTVLDELITRSNAATERLNHARAGITALAILVVVLGLSWGLVLIHHGSGIHTPPHPMGSPAPTTSRS
jgi:hypothetical protein